MKICNGIFSCFLVGLFGLNPIMQAQTLDSVLANQSPTPYFSLDSRNSSLMGTPVHLFGAKLGLEWDEQYRAGFGLYQLTTRFKDPIQVDANPPSARSRFRFRYYSLFAEYRFFHNKHWTLNGTLHLGMGRSFYKPNNRPGLPDRLEKQFVLLLGPHFSGAYRITRWLGLSGGLGYRKALIPGLVSTDGLNGGVVAIGVNVYPYALYKAIFE